MAIVLAAGSSSRFGSPKLLAPLAGFLAILLGGMRITRRQAGLISTTSVFVGFAGALVAFVDALGRRGFRRSAFGHDSRPRHQGAKE